MEDGIYVSGRCAAVVMRENLSTGTKFKEVSMMLRTKNGIEVIRMADYDGHLAVEEGKKFTAKVYVRSYLSKRTGSAGHSFVVIGKGENGNGDEKKTDVASKV